jgi:hypothetical protein
LNDWFLQVGAPGREVKAREAVARVTGLLHAALASAPMDSPEQHIAVASVLARALRLLMAQMRVLNADGANGRLALLSVVLTPGDTIRLVRSKLAARAGVAPTTTTTTATAAPPAADAAHTSDADAQPSEAQAAEASQDQPAAPQENVVSVTTLAAKLPISSRFAASSPSADHIESKVSVPFPLQ